MTEAPSSAGNAWVAIGCVSGFLAVALGAFGAHGLSQRLGERALAVYHTGAQYQMYHALGLVMLGLWCNHQGQDVGLVGWSWVIGTLLFSGSLYALALTDIKILGAITPFGGLLFLLGWIVFAFRAWKA
jgi:uncharacterized membrane protein YgdD (TMEM256/DUF423 family)